MQSQIIRHCERSEAIQNLFSFYLDRHAALRLAMTMLDKESYDPWH
jgi:hypothetical protein